MSQSSRLHINDNMCFSFAKYTKRNRAKKPESIRLKFGHKEPLINITVALYDPKSIDQVP